MHVQWGISVRQTPNVLRVCSSFGRAGKPTTLAKKNRYSREIHDVDLQFDHVILCDIELQFDIDATRTRVAVSARRNLVLQIEVSVG